MLKKILIYSFYLFLFFFIVYLVYFINTQDPYKKSIRQDIKSIIKKNTLKERLFNDYNEQHLPDTQFIKVNYKKIDLDFLNLSGCYFGSCYSFFLEQYNEKLIIAERNGFKATESKNIKDALKKFPKKGNKIVVVFGSLYLVGHALSLN